MSVVISTTATVAVPLVDSNGDEANIDGDRLHYENGVWGAGSSPGPVNTC
jgi:hypothetical protein